MRSLHNCTKRLGVALLVAITSAGCADEPGNSGNIDPSVCDTSYLNYDNFAGPFMTNWCRGCHSSSAPADMRQKAPADVNFDDAAAVRKWAARIDARTTGDNVSMPPAGGPSEMERAALAEWIACGTR